MDTRDALSILDQLDLEARQWEASNKARLQIREVITLYEKALKELEKLKETKASVENEIKSAQARSASIISGLSQDVQKARVQAESDSKNINDEVKKLRATLDIVTKEYDMTIKDRAEQSAKLAKDIESKKAEYAKITNDVNDLKKKYALGGV